MSFLPIFFSARASRRNSEAFTLVEIMIVVVIIALLTLLAVPAFERAKEKSENAVLAQHYRTFAYAFEAYATEFGEWPPTSTPGVIPEEMEGRLTGAWEETTSVGGEWTWRNNESRGPRIALDALDPSKREQMERVDAILDDGDLSTGYFLSLTENYYYLRLE